MPYDKDSLNEAKKKGMFDNNTLDPRVLQLDDEEKRRMQSDLSKVTVETAPESGAIPDAPRPFKESRKKTIQVELTLLEKILVFFLSLFGGQSSEQYKMYKAIRNIMKDLSRIRPPIYNQSTRRVTKFFALRLHDLYLRLLSVRKVLDHTMGDPQVWDNPSVRKTACEYLFERLAGLNVDEISSRFMESGIDRTLSSFDNVRFATDAVEKAVYSYISSIDKNIIDSVNRQYTNLVYFKKLADYDFVQLFRRFDAHFAPGMSPNFIDISGEALVPYLKDLEELLLQFDINMDSLMLFRVLMQIAKETGGGRLQNLPDDPESLTGSENTSEYVEARIENDVIVGIENIKDLLYKKTVTLLLQISKADPSYTPVISHTKYDLHKLYVETFEKRVKLVVKRLLKEKRTRRIDTLMRKIFPEIKWVGIYTSGLSDKLEQSSYLSFSHCYQLAIINTFLQQYYLDLVKSVLNIVLLNGSFTEAHFKKTVSDTFYSMDKLNEEMAHLAEDLAVDGNTGKKVMSLIGKKDQNAAEYRKTIERNVVTLNGMASDIYEKFLPLYSGINDIITKIFTDIEAKPPRHLRNIRGIAGFRNSRFLSLVEKSYHILGTVKELIALLKENA